MSRITSSTTLRPPASSDNISRQTIDVPALISSIRAIAAQPNTIDQGIRSDLLKAFVQARNALESPVEATLRILTQPMQAIALRLAVDMKLFEAALSCTADSTGDEVRLDQLAQHTGADPLLITRILRILVHMNFFHEVGPSTYSVAPLTHAYRQGSPFAESVIHMTAQAKWIFELPRYFEERGYSNPDDAYDGPFQFALGQKIHSFDWLATQPKLQHACNVTIATWRAQRGPRWFDVYPAAEELDVSDASTVLLVDVGGGIGHDLVAFKAKYPDTAGKLIVQDIPAVVKDAKVLPGGVEAMEHDFFAAQPVSGAGAYLLGNVLHDWPDKQALRILGHIREAMDDGSKLLIWENVLPETGVSFLSACTDLQMMASFSALERTLAQYEELLDRAGLRLIKAWASQGCEAGASGQKLLEAVRKDQ